MYNYVIFGSDEDFYKISYADIFKLDNARYLYKPLDIDNSTLTFLYRLHKSSILNKYISLPFKNIWNPFQFINSFNNSNQICFIFFAGRRELLSRSFISYLRKEYTNSKFVFFLQDLVSKQRDINIDEIKSNFDLVLSFDHGDVLKYGLVYYPLVYSKPKDKLLQGVIESDVYFVGKAKNRLKEIIATYEFLSDNGFVCDFHITGVEQKQQIYKDKINYCMQMPYIDNLRHILKTKCLLEIMQKEGTGYTLRVCEAIMYDKKLLSNNKELGKAPFFKKNNISIFNDPTKIDLSFLSKDVEFVDYEFKNKLSPLNMLDYIDKYFEKNH